MVASTWAVRGIPRALIAGFAGYPPPRSSRSQRTCCVRSPACRSVPALGALVLGLAGCGGGDDEPAPYEATYSFLPEGEECTGYDALYHNDDEHGEFWAARIDVGDTPFEVRSVRYVLEDYSPAFPDFPCDATLPHEVWVAVTQDDVPPARPEGATKIRVDPGPERPPSFAKPLALPLDPPIVVREGDELYVMVEGTGDPSAYLCLRVCTQVGDLARTHAFASNRTKDELPFSWTPLADEVNGGFPIEVDGVVGSQ